MDEKEKEQFVEFAKSMSFNDLKRLIIGQVNEVKYNDTNELASKLFSLWRLVETKAKAEPKPLVNDF